MKHDSVSMSQIIIFGKNNNPKLAGNKNEKRRRRMKFIAKIYVHRKCT